MNLMSLAATLGLDSEDFERGLDSAHSSLTSFKNSAVSAFSAIGKAATVGFAAASAAAIKMTSDSVKSYATTEQLVGGVETLFSSLDGTMSAASIVLDNAANAYKNAGMSMNTYLETVTSFASALLRSSSDTAQKLTEEEIEARKEALDDQYETTKESYEDQYDVMQKSLQNELQTLRKELNKQYQERSKFYQKQYDDLSETLSKEVEALRKSQDKELGAIRDSQDEQIEAYQKATDKRIKLINKEYLESVKLVDEEKYNRLKAIEDEIDALNGLTEAEKEADRQEEISARRSELEKYIATTSSAARRKKAEKALAEYNEQIAKEDAQNARKAQIEELRNQKDAINEEASAKKEALAEQKDARLEAVREESNQWLKETRKANQQYLDTVRENQSNQVEALRKANAEKLSNLKESQNAELEAYQNGQNEQLEALQETNEKKLAEDKKYFEKQLKALKKSLDKQKKLLTDDADVGTEAPEMTQEAYEKAAKVADIAIRDIADNANKMGTPMEALQVAYQGFAKQNYTMLDNLKLGYGGTKTEMERLLADAEKFSGVHYDISNLQDVFQAIHVIQQEMGISGRTAEEAADIIARTGRSEEEVFERLGTTALEANTTIEGSTNRMKAAWQNLVSGMADPNADIGQLVDDFVESASTSLDNLLPAIERALSGIGTLIDKLAPKIADRIPWFIENVLPHFVNAAFTIMWAVIENFPLIAQTIAENIPTIIDKFKTALDEHGPEIKEKAKTLIDNLIQGVKDHGPAIVEGAINAITKFSEAIKNNAGPIMDKGLELIEALANSVIENIPTLVEKAPEIIINLATAIIENLPKLAETALEIMKKLREELVASIPELLKAVPKIWEALRKAFLSKDWKSLGSTAFTDVNTGIGSMLPLLGSTAKHLGEKAIERFKNSGFVEAGKATIILLLNGIEFYLVEIPNKFKEIANNAKNAFFEIDWLGIGRDIINGIVNGITEMGSAIWDAIKDAAGSAFESLMEFLGIASPSKLFRDKVGKMIPLGMAVGIEANADAVEDAMDELGDIAFDPFEDEEFISTRTYDIPSVSTAGAQTQGTPFGQVLGLLQLISDSLSTIRDEDRNVYLDGQKVADLTVDRMNILLGRKYIMENRGV